MTFGKEQTDWNLIDNKYIWLSDSFSETWIGIQASTQWVLMIDSQKDNNNLSLCQLWAQMWSEALN